MSEKDENKDIPQAGQQEQILAEYIIPLYKQPKFWRWIFLGIVAVVMVLIYKVTIIDKTIDPEVLKSSIEIFNIDSKWVVSEEVDTPEFKGIILVPQISFQVRNIGSVKLSYVRFLGIFSLLGKPKDLGDSVYVAFKKPLEPGIVDSQRIILTAKYGYKATSKQAFSKNSKEWRSCAVDVLVSSGTSQLIKLKTYYVSRRIDGIEIDIKMTDKPMEEIVKGNQ